MNLFYFDKFLLLYLWFFIDISDCENPLAKCSVNQPFKLIDSNCGSFEEVCLKKGDDQCDNLMNACQQCPSTNYTLPILVNILKMLKTEIYEMKLNQTAEIKTIKAQLNNTESMKSQKKIDHILGLIIFLVVIVLLLITLIVIEVRFKIITKSIQRKKKRTPTRNNNCNGDNTKRLEPNTANEDPELTTDGQDTPFLRSRKLNDLGNVEKQLHKRLDRIASEINTNTNSKISNVLRYVNEQLNDHLDKISSEIRSIKNNSDIPEENESVPTINLEGRDKENEVESTPNTENIEIKPIIESEGNSERISIEVNSRISVENNDKVLEMNHNEE